MSTPHAAVVSSGSSQSAARIAEAPPDRPFVVAQLGQSLDGRIATLTGESQWINGEAALNHVHKLRAAVDAVIVGIGTVLADNPRLNVRRVPGRSPARVVIDPSGRLPSASHCLSDDGVRRVIVTADDTEVSCGCAEIVRVARRDGRLPPQVIIQSLFSLGLRTFLIEGGAQTVSTFLEADAIDRLHVLVAPVILGSGKPGLTLSPIASLAQARRPMTDVHVLEGGDVLFDCNLRQRTEGGSHGTPRPQVRGGGL
jgi:riboflavin-specific deaminase-like protein